MQNLLEKLFHRKTILDFSDGLEDSQDDIDVVDDIENLEYLDDVEDLDECLNY